MQTTGLVATALLLVAQSSAERSIPDPDTAHVSHAVVSLIDFAAVPAKQSGVLKSLSLEDGTRVQEGLEVSNEALLGELDNEDALARRQAAELDHKVSLAEEAKSDVQIVAADKTSEVAHYEYLESLEVNKRARGSIPETQLRRQLLTEERARAEATVARRDQDTAGFTVELREAQMELARINLDRHVIKSPLDGEVVQVYRHVGEWVNAGDPIVRVVRLDRLRVEGFLKLSEYGRQAVDGQPVQVRLQGVAQPMAGRISYVSPLIQATGDYRVWCEVDNRKENGHWVMLPGMDADMVIQLKKHQLAGN